MKHSFRTVDFGRLTQFWNEFYPERYRIDEDILRANTVESSVFDWGASCVEEADGEILGFVIVKRPAAKLYGNVDQDAVNLSAIGYCDPHFGVDLLADLKRLLRNRGYTKLLFGQDSRHFFPGCPEDCPLLTGFLTVEGFEGTHIANDLERDLLDFENTYSPLPGTDLRVLTTEDIPSLEAFLTREFPNRWRYDVLAKVKTDGPSCVYALFIDGKVEGFALLQRGNQRLPLGGAVWKASLGENWGSMGPLGISEHLRGRGHGGALLSTALDHMRDQGVRQCIIDWTTLTDLYAKFGFEVSRRYRMLSLPLEG